MSYPKSEGFDPESHTTRLFAYKMWKPGSARKIETQVFLETTKAQYQDRNSYECRLYQRRWSPKKEAVAKQYWPPAGTAKLTSATKLSEKNGVVTLRVKITMDRGDNKLPTGLFYAELRHKQNPAITSKVGRIVRQKWEAQRPFDTANPTAGLNVLPAFKKGFDHIAKMEGHFRLNWRNMTPKQIAAHIQDDTNRMKFFRQDKHRDLWLSANYIQPAPQRKIRFATEQAIVFFRIRVNNKKQKPKPNKYPNTNPDDRWCDTARAYLELYLVKLDGSSKRPKKTTKFVKAYHPKDKQEFTKDMKHLSKGAYAKVTGDQVELVAGY